MQLASVTTLLSVVGLAQTPDYLAIGNAELDAASLALETDLNCSFDQVTQTDIFMPYANEILKKLKVKNGFITPSSFEALYARTEAAWFLGQSANITSALQVDYERGSFFVNAALAPLFGDYNYIFGAQYGQTPFYGIASSYWQVTYQSGFPVSEDNPDQYDLTVVPSWLQTLALLKARISLQGHPSAVAAGVTYNKSTLEDQYAAICAKRTLYSPDCILPRL